uniref:CS domain-containing protein n=1 Tax=Corethron hystrix TaxID=216773 RepID=A0A7S1FMH3_9STRA|mmetsp:Transcript_1603/g.3402  ORF Transcript_1603/g.3402 Transcript_1603/m.3402 type:complete len:207 (+) Transcript_1603:193-813(+)|eukprot:CAMPEP_0113297556 /NCGR_PEP_ID=MMETSP0010_2-20120614/366_1 /TAXON_ID=216773 ORGANISM="Corethron hystrix, Strain 308" /NCGR_SAMPLE_ID=MMETSP0010_2 /ASSEMBLY_ACC=CAM_ASM_000155 /LENGTH=206 /DNA_ID=CAMNT_0000150459 /DNA_START=130 /DNA_END=750 /DNA_ORIENTATION=+ /assembly_acc=CAM_ASM_000155
MTERELSACDFPSASTNALRDNIEKKGKNSYYFAHSHKATGPEWDGKIEPKFLNATASNIVLPQASVLRHNSSTIKSYAFLDDGKKVKVYVELPGIGRSEEKNDSDGRSEDSLQSTTPTMELPPKVDFTWSDSSFTLSIKNYTKAEVSDPPKVETLVVPCLYDNICKAEHRVKTDRIVIILTKASEKNEITWPSLSAASAPDNEVV